MAAEKIKVLFIEGDKKTEVEALVGRSILEVAHQNEIDLEGACEGSLACATCHVILEEDVYNKLDEPEEAEEDMLDLAFGLTHTSRLGCQIILTKELDGMKIILPSATRNISL
jgi:ferredoxin